MYTIVCKKNYTKNQTKMKKVIFKLINDLLEADKLGKQNIATYNLTEGIEDYAKQRVIEELEELKNICITIGRGMQFVERIDRRITKLKQD